MRKKKKWALAVVALILLAAIAGRMLLGQEENALRGYSEYAVQTGDLQTWYSFEGTVAAARMQNLIAPAGGTVQEVYVRQGQNVEKGDRIARLSGGLTLKADMAGEIAELNVDKDDVVSAGAAIACIMDMSRLEAEIRVDEYDVHAVQAGQRMQVNVGALDASVEAEVERVSRRPIVGAGVSYYTAALRLEEMENLLPGMQVEARLLQAEAKNAPLVKMDMLSFDEQNRPYVLVKQGEEAVKTYVDVGINNGNYVQITGGLSAGDIVLYRSYSIELLMEQMR